MRTLLATIQIVEHDKELLGSHLLAAFGHLCCDDNIRFEPYCVGTDDILGAVSSREDPRSAFLVEICLGKPDCPSDLIAYATQIPFNTWVTERQETVDEYFSRREKTPPEATDIVLLAQGIAIENLPDVAWSLLHKVAERHLPQHPGLIGTSGAW